MPATQNALFLGSPSALFFKRLLLRTARSRLACAACFCTPSLFPLAWEEAVPRSPPAASVLPQGHLLRVPPSESATFVACSSCTLQVLLPRLLPAVLSAFRDTFALLPGPGGVAGWGEAEELPGNLEALMMPWASLLSDLAASVSLAPPVWQRLRAASSSSSAC